MSAINFIKAPGKLVPDEFLKAALVGHNQAIGVAVQSADNTIHVVRLKDQELTLEGLSEFINRAENRDQAVLVCLQDKAVFEDDVGPFTILSDNDTNPVVIAALDGDFSAHASNESEHSPASFAAEKIRAQLKKLYNLANGDVQKLFEELADDEFFIQGMQGLMTGAHGNITLMDNRANVIHINIKDDKSSGNTDFGWASNLVEAGVEKPKGLADTLSSALGKVKSKLPELPGKKPIASTTPITPQPAAEPAKVVPPAGPAAPDTNVPAAAPGEMLTIRVPSQFKNDGKRRKWFEHRIPSGGPLPDGWKTAQTLSCNRSSATKDFMESWTAQNKGLSAVATALGVDTKPKTAETAPAPTVDLKKSKLPELPTAKQTPPATSKPAAAATSKKEGEYPERETALRKDTSTHTVSNDKPGIVEGPLAIIPPGEKQKIMALLENTDFRAMLDRHAQAMADPEKVKRLEDRVPTFKEQIGNDKEDVDNWPYAAFKKIATDAGLNAITILAFTYKTQYMEMKEFADQLLSEIETIKAASAPVKSPAEQAVAARRGKLPPLPGAAA